LGVADAEVLLTALLTPDVKGIVERWRGREPEELITHRLLAKRFRKSPLDPAVAIRVSRVVWQSLRRRRPLRLMIPMGGYKSPSSPEHPSAGWAELFAVAGFCELAAPICAVHPPGVVVDFSSDEALVPLFTGAPPKVLDDYRSAFDEILKFAGGYQPGNLVLRQSFVRDDYDVAALIRRLKVLGAELESEWFPALPAAEQERLLRAAANNGFQARSPEELRRSVCEHQAYLTIDERERGHLLYRADTVPVALRRGLPGWLHLGANSRSVTQFWIGSGVVDLTGGRPAAHILPPRRAAAALPRSTRLPYPRPPVPGLARLPVLAYGETRHSTPPRPRRAGQGVSDDRPFPATSRDELELRDVSPVPAVRPGH
ncbi:hypothetical protein, partial [Streptomyces anulatus]|uniref:hypothetical protein n=1 Tax=Streptomyces anulatus TaxID=1892 RepID=UPI003432E878